MSRSVHEIEHVVFLARVLQEHCERTALETNLATDLILAVVSKLVLTIQIPAFGLFGCCVRLLHNHVTEQGFSTVKVPTEGH